MGEGFCAAGFRTSCEDRGIPDDRIQMIIKAAAAIVPFDHTTLQPWPAAPKMLAGEGRMDHGAIMDYLATVKKWLDQQNTAAGDGPEREPNADSC